MLSLHKALPRLRSIDHRTVKQKPLRRPTRLPKLAVENSFAAHLKRLSWLFSGR